MRHVLVIEDEYLTAQCMADMVLYAGVSSVDIAESEAVAVEAACRHRPTVIVSDVNLKEGGRGPDAVSRIHELCGTIPTIFVTGDPHIVKACIFALAVLEKPVQADRFAFVFAHVARAVPSWRTPG